MSPTASQGLASGIFGLSHAASSASSWLLVPHPGLWGSLSHHSSPLTACRGVWDPLFFSLGMPLVRGQEGWECPQGHQHWSQNLLTMPVSTHSSVQNSSSPSPDLVFFHPWLPQTLPQCGASQITWCSTGNYCLPHSHPISSLCFILVVPLSQRLLLPQFTLCWELITLKLNSLWVCSSPPCW